MPSCFESMTHDECLRTLICANDNYYNQSFSEMSDKEFDDLKDSFRKRFPDDPFLTAIGAPPPEVSEWQKTKHNLPMYSCNKVNTIEELEKWIKDNGLEDSDLVASEKLDGISLDICYLKGTMTHAITRGDGIVGENIIQNVSRMQGVKTKLPIPYSGSIRGEIMMHKTDLKNVNTICEARGDRPYQNVRNAASGIARNMDGKFSEYLFVQFYQATGSFVTKHEVFEFLENDLGLGTSSHWFGNAETCKLVYNEYEMSTRAGLDHEIDGIVIEANDLAVQKKLGMLHENLRGQIAWKFTSEKARTRIVDIHWQLGDSARITPVAEVEPVWVSGVTIRKASLHNYENFMKVKPFKGAVCIISRRGDVIPYIEQIFDR